MFSSTYSLYFSVIVYARMALLWFANFIKCHIDCIDCDDAAQVISVWQKPKSSDSFQSLMWEAAELKTNIYLM